MKTYVLIVSEYFPKTHKKAGQKTNFIEKISNKEKIHTIRASFELWHKRFEEIEKGKACLSVRVWDGVVRKSKQIEKFRFTNLDGIGLQKLEFKFSDLEMAYICGFPFSYYVNEKSLCRNDGLEIDDFTDWFKSYDLSQQMAIIHFTNFRY